MSKEVYQSTFVVERKVGEKAAVFIEWVGDFPSDEPARHLPNSGAVLHLSKTEQIDFHIGAGLDKEALSFVFGIGYSYASIDCSEAEWERPLPRHWHPAALSAWAGWLRRHARPTSSPRRCAKGCQEQLYISMTASANTGMSIGN